MDGSTYLTGRPQLANLYLLLLPPTPTPSQQILLIYQSSAISYPLPGSQVKSKTCPIIIWKIKLASQRQIRNDNILIGITTTQMSCENK